MKRNAKIVLAVLAALLAGGGGIAAVQMPVRADVVTLGASSVSLTFTEQGTYDYRQRFSVFPLLAGEVLEVRVREGDTVAPGDVLAVVNASDYGYQMEGLQNTINGYQGQISDVWLKEEQRKAEIAAGLERLESELAALDAEIGDKLEGNDSLVSQVQIQEEIVATNRRAVYHSRNHLRETRDYGDDAEIQAARVSLNTAENALAQSELLLEQLRGSDLSEEVLEAQRQTLKTQLETTQLQMEKSYTGGLYQYYNAQIAAAETSMRQLEEQSGRAEIATPVGGVVSALPIRDQNLAGQQTQVAVIGREPYVEVFVPVRDIASVVVGDTVELILDRRTGEEIFGGTVVEIERDAQTKLSAIGVEERKVRVFIRPDRPDLQIGYSLDVRFTVDSWEKALTVPKTAVFSLDGIDHVWKLADGKATAHPIGSKIEVRDQYLVQSGLEPGDRILMDADNADVREGRRVAG